MKHQRSIGIGSLLLPPHYVIIPQPLLHFGPVYHSVDSVHGFQTSLLLHRTTKRYIQKADILIPLLTAHFSPLYWFWWRNLIEAPCTKVQGIFQARKGFICCSSLANPRSKLRGMRSLFLFKSNPGATAFPEFCPLSDE